MKTDKKFGVIRDIKIYVNKKKKISSVHFAARGTVVL